MSQIEFEDQESMQTKVFKSRKILGEYQIPGMVKFVMKVTGIKDEKIGYYFLIAVFFVCVVISVVLVWSPFSLEKGKTVYLEDIPKPFLEKLHPATLNTIPSRNQ